MPGRLLGIDHGLKRIGLALSDLSWLVARELAVLRRRSRAEDFARISQIIAQHQVVALVVGLPSDLDAPAGSITQAETVRRWVERLAAVITLPVVLWDEQLTTADARDLARQKRRAPGEPVDDLAARLILQSYMDALRDGMAPSPLRAP